MKKSFFIVFLFLFANVHAQLKTVSDFNLYTGDAPFISVADTLQGGFFNRYDGPDVSDGGMVFTDGKNRKWKRYTTDEKLRIRWYGIYPHQNHGGWKGQSGSDDAIFIRKAIAYIRSHYNQFNTLKFDYCTPNTWYHIGSTVEHGGVNLEGVGTYKMPRTLFSVAPDVTAFRLPAGNHNYAEVKDIAIQHGWDYSTNKTDSNNHSWDIHTNFFFENVHVIHNPGGNGFNVDACAYADPSDSINFGNSDQARFQSCQADECLNGFFIDGCDANVIGLMDCSAVSNQYWGIYDNGLLGNKYWNLHLSNNGKTTGNKSTGATIGGYIDGVWRPDARTYFLLADYDNDGKFIETKGKRPDLYPNLWYQNQEGLGGVTVWDSTKQYHTGGGVWAANPNASHLFVGTYTESHSPANIISPRSVWLEGLNGAMVIGGSFEHTIEQQKIFSGKGGINAARFYSFNQSENPAFTGNSNGSVVADLTTKMSYLTLALHNSQGTGKFSYSGDEFQFQGKGVDYAKLSLKGFAPYSTSGVMDLGEPSLQFRNVYAIKYFGDGSALTGIKSDTQIEPGLWIFPIGDQTAAITSGYNKFSFRLPFGCTITDVRFNTATSSTAGVLLFDVKANGSSILNRKVSIDAGEKTSLTARVLSSVVTKALPDDAEISVDFEAVGAGVKGVKVNIYYKK